MGQDDGSHGYSWIFSQGGGVGSDVNNQTIRVRGDDLKAVEPAGLVVLAGSDAKRPPALRSPARTDCTPKF